MSRQIRDLTSRVDQALDLLGIRNFLLGIQDPAFPGLPGEDPGRGSPYSDGAARFLEFARSLGFRGIQLGPQGITPPANPSPYDGSLFSKNPLSLAPLPLTREPWGLLTADEVAGLVTPGPAAGLRVSEIEARAVMERIIAAARGGHERRIAQSNATPGRLEERFHRFCRQNAGWLERDALYEALRRHYGEKTWKDWQGDENALLDRHLFAPPPGLRHAVERRHLLLLDRYRDFIDTYSFGQFLLAGQHRQLRDRCRRLGLKLFGDCQIGISGRDAWYARSFLLEDYVMGAPPSRTNPEGQPWNYPVPDPRSYHYSDPGGRHRPGPAIRFLRERVDKLLTEFDGLRIDHPHGLVCPWVYRAGEEDPIRAVQQGARLFASPDLPDHPGLAEFAIVRPDQLDRRVDRHADHWVTDLDQDQVHRYAALFEVIMTAARRNGRTTCQIACEILSTQPYPIERVMELYGLGRFRVTQKADLTDENDVYRSENGRPEDWLMLGNHDTPTIWRRTGEWLAKGEAGRQARYLAGRLNIPEKERSAWIERLSTDAGALAQAKFADLFIGPARNIMVFFTDLLGIRQAYNTPGTVSECNWTLRIHPGYRRTYLKMLEKNRALNIPRALALALKARGLAGEHGELVRELEAFPG